MFNSWTINLVLGLILSVMAGVGYLTWKNSIEESAVAELKIQQLETELKAQQQLVEDLTAINKESNEIISDLKNKEINLNQKLRDLDSYLSTHKDDKESSEVLKRTFKELSQ
jgi:predicted RNase H-like nuclease (RuvC/YqgF family)